MSNRAPKVWAEMTQAERLRQWDEEDAAANAPAPFKPVLVEPSPPPTVQPPPVPLPASDMDAKGHAARKLAWIEQLSLDAGLSSTGLRVGLRIASQWSRVKGYAWPSQTTLAAELGVKERSIKYAVADLIQRGHMTVRRVSRTASNHYLPTIAEGKQGCTSTATPRGNSPAPRTDMPEVQKRDRSRCNGIAPNTFEEPYEGRRGRQKDVGSASAGVFPDRGDHHAA